MTDVHGTIVDRHEVNTIGNLHIVTVVALALPRKRVEYVVMHGDAVILRTGGGSREDYNQAASYALGVATGLRLAGAHRKGGA